VLAKKDPSYSMTSTYKNSPQVTSEASVVFIQKMPEKRVIMVVDQEKPQTYADVKDFTSTIVSVDSLQSDQNKNEVLSSPVP
jgi:hypothetical protein